MAQLNDLGRIKAYRMALTRAVSEGCHSIVEWSGDYSALGLVAMR